MFRATQSCVIDLGGVAPYVFDESALTLENSLILTT